MVAIWDDAGILVLARKMKVQPRYTKSSTPSLPAALHGFIGHHVEQIWATFHRILGELVYVWESREAF